MQPPNVAQKIAALGERRDQRHEMSGSVLALYATADEALAVAQGRFGAHPVALAPRSDMEPATGCTMPIGSAAPRRASCVRTKAGTLGWLPAT